MADVWRGYAGALPALDEALPGETSGELARPAPERLRAMFDAHHARIWRVLRRLGVPSSAADDAAQEVFVIAARRLGDILPDAEQAFLLGTARRVAAASRRHSARLSERELAPEELVHPGPLPEQALTSAEERRLLDSILAELDDDAREVFVLFELEGISRSEVALLLGIPEGTAASRLKRARAQFLGAAERIKARLAHRTGGRP